MAPTTSPKKTEVGLGRRSGLLALAFLLLALPVPLLAEEITMPGLDGGKLSESDLQNGDSILIVWATWSPHCRDIVSRANAVAGAWAGKAKVQTIVFQEQPGAVRSFLAGTKLSPSTYIDASGAFSKKHAVTTLPGLLIFKNGKLTFSGKLPSDPTALIKRSLS